MATEHGPAHLSHARSGFRSKLHARTDKPRASLHRSGSAQRSASVSHQQMATKVRGILGSYRNITYNVRLPSVLGGEIYFPIAAIIRGPDLNQLAEISKKVADRMHQYPDLVDVNPSLNLNTPELQVKVDRQRAADIGVRMTDISDAVRLFYSGEDEITRFKEGSEQYPVTMQLLPEQRDNPDVLNRMMVPSTKLGQVRLESVATIGRGFGPATLWRYNREFQVSVYANVASGYPLDLGAAHTDQLNQRNRAAGRLFISVLRTGKSARGNNLEPFAGDAAGIRLHVHGAGGPI